ncbi:ABC transporter substrate-binding protein [Ferroplasma sp.]|uniref:ABC transporter substrate-binding protein n=1 Tax=Ferroplasma sp. TaxID=2591003 RepID=UPI00307EEC1A
MNLDKSRNYKRFVIVFAIVVALMFMMEPLSGNLNGNVYANSTTSTATPQISSSASAAPITSTSGTYILGQIGNPDYVNAYEESTVCDFYLSNLIYNSATTELTNGTYYYCLANNITESKAPAGMTTFDPVTGATMPVTDIYTLHIRPGVEWDDYNSSNAADTYVYSNYTSFTNASGVAYTHPYKNVYNATSGKNQSFSPITMKTEYVQAADFILSWKILQSSTEYSGSYLGVVNVLPLNNLTVEYYLTAPSSTFIPYTAETPVLPYHIWVSHDYASSGSGIWNETSSTTLSASNAYNEWDLGHSGPFGAGNGEYPGLVGTGPFMMNGGYGMPVGKLFTSDYWQVYANPNYFLKDVKGNDGFEGKICNDVSRFSPQIYSLKVEIFSGPSPAISALKDGSIDAIESDLSSSFVSTASSIPGVVICDKPSTGYAYFKFNSFAADAPFNITAFRQALREASPLGDVQTAICDGDITAGYSTIPEINSAWYDSDVPTYTFSLTTANATIAGIPGMTYKAGEWYYHGTEVTATIQSPSESLIPQIFTGYETIASDWNSIGIKTTLSSESFSTEITHLDAYGQTAASPSASYNVITLGVSGLLGDVVGDLVTDFNYTESVGTGDYQGPFSSLTITNATRLCDTLFNVKTGTYTGTQIDSLMTNLTTFASTNLTLKDDVLAVDFMQYIEDEESTMMPIGYGPLDHIAVNTNTFTGVTLVSGDINSFWYYNEMSVHLRSAPVKVTVPTQHAVVKSVISETNLTDGLYGNVTFTVTDNKTGKALANATVTVGENPSLLPLNASLEVNDTGLTGKTNSTGVFVYYFEVSNQNIVFNVPGYNGNVTISAIATPHNTSIAAGTGTTYLSDYPYPVAFSFSSLSPLSSSYQYFNMTVYNPLNGTPISGYLYTIQVAQAVAVLKNTTPDQKITVISTYSPPSVCNYTALSVPVNATYNDPNVQSISGYTNSTGGLSIMIMANSTFNYTLNGNSAEYNLYIGDFALAAPVGGEPPYVAIGEVTSSTNPNGYGTGEPFEIPVVLEQHINSYKITVTSNHPMVSYNGVNELTFTVMNGTTPVKGYTLNVTSQNAEGANRGYFLDSTSTAPNPNYALLTTFGPETGSQYLPSITLHTDAAGKAYANFTSGFYTITNGVLSGMQYYNHAVLPYDQYIINVNGDGAMAVGQSTVESPQAVTQLYSVSFSETGLPSGYYWMVNLTNYDMTTGPINTTTYTYELTNGTYDYAISSTNGKTVFSPVTYTGNFTVDGKNITMSPVHLVYYNATFTETGLPSGYYWMVNLTNYDMTTGPINTTTYTYELTNGTYDYAISSTNGKTVFSPVTYTGNFTVNGANVFKSVHLAYYKATFTEKGLASGVSWNLNLTTLDMNLTVTGTSTSIELTNGTYNYTLYAKGYTHSKNSSFTVNGKNITESVTFTKIVKIVNDTIYYIIGGVVAAIVVIGGLAYYFGVYKKKKITK